jgi:hypothetical protein
MKATYTILAAVLFLIQAQASAKTLYCSIKENDAVVSSERIESDLGRKVALGPTRMTRAYVTEQKNASFTVEAFLPDYEIRIYGQGAMRAPTDQVSASFWSRDALIEIICSAQPRH